MYEHSYRNIGTLGAKYELPYGWISIGIFYFLVIAFAIYLSYKNTSMAKTTRKSIYDQDIDYQEISKANPQSFKMKRQ